MHIDAKELENNSLIEGDICIIGAGAAGITMAMEWLGSPHKVILLEGGGFEYEDRVQELYNGKNTGQKYYPLKSTRLHYFGGTSGHWAGFCSIFDEADFGKRDWVENSGWPITLADLIPFYTRAHNYLDLGPFEYGTKYWQDKDPSLIPLPLNPAAVWNKVWRFSAPTRFGAKYKDRVVSAGNIHLYTYANVVRIHTEENISSVREIIVKNYTGKEQRVRAKYFIMACCGIQNARLLLASDHQAPAGLGNDHDLVGRYFMEHLEIRSGELWLNRPSVLKMYKLNPLMRLELAISAQKQSEFKILNGTVALTPLELAKRMKPAIVTWSKEDPRESEEQIHDAYEKANGGKIDRYIESRKKHDAFSMDTRMEQAPNPDSRVVLDTEKDELGVPRANLHWQLTEQEKLSIRKIHEIIGQEMGAAGIGRVKMLDWLLDESHGAYPSFTSGGWHHMGTTRMADDPKKGVVDANCKLHKIDNLFIAGSSCFPTGGSVNPTLTLVALTLRLSDHLKTKMI